jgi:SAM-dependent methyltransferase
VELDPKQIVTAGYDTCGPRYNAARARDPSPELQRLLGVLAPGAGVLDIGCGGGVPVTAALARRASVTGVDISTVQIEEARKRLPDVRVIVGDIMSQEFEPASFDAVVSFYTLFHLPREEHRPLLERVARWLRPGGHLLATVASSDRPGYTEPDFFGVSMYWSHFEPAWYASVLNELGFEVLERGVLGHGYRDVAGLPPERHPVVFARGRREHS